MTGEPELPAGSVELAPGYRVPLLVVGLWQLSEGHSSRAGAGDPLGWLGRFVEAGFDTFDCADIYTGVEETLGRLIASRPPGSVRVHTKFVPDRGALPAIDRPYVRSVIERSLRRLGVERLDLVQFHWWDFEVDGWVETAGWLEELRREGKIRHVGLTNFDAARLRGLLAAGIRPVSDQVQYSLLDRRPATALAPLAAAEGFGLLAYGTLAGGLLSERWLGAPDPSGGWENRSLQKYGLIVEDAGGWEPYQRLLRTLAAVASGRGLDAATVATRWVLDQPGVAAAVVGARDAAHLDAWRKTLSLQLSEEERCTIADALTDLPGPTGAVYELERVPGGRHAAIMRTDLNRASAAGPRSGARRP